jgi:hypothetical protein
MRLNIPRRVSITLKNLAIKYATYGESNDVKNRASKRLSGEGLATCYFCHAQLTQMSQSFASRFAPYIKKNILARLGLLGNE